jgi:hypothetical protein
MTIQLGTGIQFRGLGGDRDLLNPLHVSATCMPGGHASDRVAVIAGQSITIHLVGQKYISKGIYTLLDGQDTGICSTRLISVSSDEVHHSAFRIVFLAKR